MRKTSVDHGGGESVGEPQEESFEVRSVGTAAVDEGSCEIDGEGIHMANKETVTTTALAQEADEALLQLDRLIHAFMRKLLSMIYTYSISVLDQDRATGFGNDFLRWPRVLIA